MRGQQTGKYTRKPNQLTINLDGSGKVSVCSGIGYLDHAEQLAFHGLFDLELQ